MSQHIQQPQYVHYTPQGLQQTHGHPTTQFIIQQPIQYHPQQQQQPTHIQYSIQQHHQPVPTPAIQVQNTQHAPIPTHHQQQQPQQQQQQQLAQSLAQAQQQHAAAAPAVAGQVSSGSATPGLEGDASTTPSQNGLLVATGDWASPLVQLAKQAELKKHALTLQLHTAHILSAHASLEQKDKSIQDLREQKNKLESERTRLLNCLRDINADRDRVDLMEATLQREREETEIKIKQLTDGDYAVAKADVDRLRGELGQPPLPSLQATLEERQAQYLSERRLNGAPNGTSSQTHQPSDPSTNPATGGASTSISTGPSSGSKRPAPISEANGGTLSAASQDGPVKRPRGRPKGSKNKSKADGGS